MSSRVKVLYIAGNGRSGSTILNVVLGQADGLFAVGELRRIWDRGVQENRLCGCGVCFRACKTWSDIFGEAYGNGQDVNAARMVYYRETLTQTKHLPAMLLASTRERKSATYPQEFLTTLDRLYAAIGRVTGCAVVVDASKWPMYGYIVGLLPAVELYVVHLVRDPRAVAFSWARSRKFEPSEFLPRQGLLKSTAYWLAWNPGITFLWNRPTSKYLLLQYERFAADPRRAIAEIIEFLGEEQRPLPFTDDKTIALQPTHAVAGNAARLCSGPVTIAADDEWERKMASRTKLIVSALTWPLLRSYGYGIRSRR